MVDLWCSSEGMASCWGGLGSQLDREEEEVCERVRGGKERVPHKGMRVVEGLYIVEPKGSSYVHDRSMPCRLIPATLK
ncbi:hypothetical protein DVH24_030197 [Malus domestica]|uniref:Uncharacterized protein n=1 Tax=Malus domestica TaxID=3750 RepID=A0A498HVK3_MALDO|nr:hypothetical protein DVH24_030197 [Malus domestica]